MELSWQLTHTYRNPLLQVVRGVKTIAAFKVKVTFFKVFFNMPPACVKTTVEGGKGGDNHKDNK